MRSSIRPTLSIMVVAAAVCATPPCHANTIHGVGNSPCSEYVAVARSESPRLVSNYENWVLGYLSGANMMLTGINPQHNLLSLVKPAQVAERLRAVCIAPSNGNAKIYEVALQMLGDLQAKMKASK
jgi:hypothetical protein